MELHKYLRGQVWQVYDDTDICIVAVSPEENCMIGFNYTDKGCNYTQLRSLIPEDMKFYIGTITNNIVLQEILYNYEKMYTSMLKTYKPHIKKQSTAAPTKKAYHPRGHKPHHIRIHCIELDRTFESMRECERFLGVNHGVVRYAMMTGKTVDGKYTFMKV